MFSGILTFFGVLYLIVTDEKSIFLYTLLFVNLSLLGIYQNKMITLNVSSESKKYALGQTFYSFLKLIFILLLFLMGKQFEFVFVAQIMSLILIILVLEDFNQIISSKVKMPRSIEVIKIIKFGLAISLVFSSDIIFSFLNISFANYYFSEYELGIYSANYNIFNLIGTFFPSVVYLLFISKVYKYKEDRSILRSLFKKLYLYTISMNFITVILSLVLGEELLSIAASDDHAELFSSTFPLLLGFILFSWIKIEVLKAQLYEISRNKIIIVLGINIIISISISCFLYNYYGITGGVLASVLGYLSLFISLYIINYINR